MQIFYKAEHWMTGLVAGLMLPAFFVCHVIIAPRPMEAIINRQSEIIREMCRTEAEESARIKTQAVPVHHVKASKQRRDNNLGSDDSPHSITPEQRPGSFWAGPSREIRTAAGGPGHDESLSR